MYVHINTGYTFIRKNTKKEKQNNKDTEKTVKNDLYLPSDYFPTLHDSLIKEPF